MHIQTWNKRDSTGCSGSDFSPRVSGVITRINVIWQFELLS